MTKTPKLTPTYAIDRLKKLESQKLITSKELFGMNSKFDAKIVKKLIRQLLDDPSATTKSQGDKLEALAKYLLEGAGFVCDLRHGQKNKQHQIDHFGELQPHVCEFLKGKDVHLNGFLGESKNYPDAKIDVNIVYKVESLKLLTKAGLGCYFARKTLTGNELSAAQSLMKDFYGRFKTISIIFMDDDWEYLHSNPLKFSDLVYSKIINYCSNYDCRVTDYTTI